MKEETRVISIRLPLSVLDHLDMTCDVLHLRSYREYIEGMLILSDKLIESRQARLNAQLGGDDESTRED